MNIKSINLANLILFYIVWWGTLFSVSLDNSYISPILTIIFLTVHLSIISNRKEEIALLVKCGLIGFFVESSYLYLGVLSYKNQYFSILFPPIWMICIWITIGMSINYSMSFLSRRMLLMAFWGSFFGPISYIAGMKAGIIYFHLPMNISILILSIVSCMCLSLIYFINNKERNKIGV